MSAGVRSVLWGLLWLWQAVGALRLRHHGYEDMVRTLFKVQRECPFITRVYSIGRSVQNRHLYVLEISDNPGIHEPLEPEVKYVANMHGNEVLGRELLLALAQLLCEQHKLRDPRITSLLQGVRIHLLPSMNPDGYQLAAEQGYGKYLGGRGNARGVDLNRNFPDLHLIPLQADSRGGRNHHLPLADNWTEQVEPETLAVINWMKSYNFVLSANLHGGAVLANYPFDKASEPRARGSRRHPPSPTPDDKLFRQLAKVYSYAHGWMHQGSTCGEYFPDGITNGAQWYPISRGMQDFNYLHTNCLEITLELSCAKFPPARELPREWAANQEALLTYLEQVHRGIKGMILDENGNGIDEAVISVDGINHDMTSGLSGDYFRLLLPGQYTVTVSAKGYKSKTANVIVYPQEVTRVDFQLVPGIQALPTANLTEIPGNPQPSPQGLYPIPHRSRPQGL
eukprot:gi/632974796/ref/XP_007903875.1/ PREDICTED: carboxypeptidase N catalytic chain isoform X2 [Callorhinchus milii]